MPDKWQARIEEEGAQVETINIEQAVMLRGERVEMTRRGIFGFRHCRLQTLRKDERDSRLKLGACVRGIC